MHDNLALLSARDGAVAGGVPLVAAFVLDPWFITSGRVGGRRLRFLLEALHDLHASLEAVGVPLLVLRGAPTDALPSLWKACGVRLMTWEDDSEPYARERDAQVAALAAKHGVETARRSGHTLFPLDDLLERCPEREPPTKYNDFVRLVEAVGPPAEPLPACTRLPDALISMALAGMTTEQRTAMAVPATLAQMGFTAELPTEPSGHAALRGGETAALQRLASVVEARGAWVRAFSKPSTNPLQWSPGSTTMLSPFLKFGCLSCRRLYHAIAAAYAGHRQHTTPPQSLDGQLLWREFFYLLSYATPHFGQAASPLCLQIAWRDPCVDAAAAEALRRWEEGTTGVPLVDAAMRQLRSTGWLHHLLRHVVACFLTRGQLWIDWQAGRDVFDRYLLDSDWAINSANWQWLSATSFFYTYHRVYSPAHFALKYDRTGQYVRQFVPELRNMPNEFVYEPWKASLEVQRAAGCILGQEYPTPICDPDAAAAANLRKMDACYQAAPPAWKALIPPAAAAELARERGIDVRGKHPHARAFEPVAAKAAACVAASAASDSPASHSTHEHRQPPPVATAGPQLAAPRQTGAPPGQGRRGRGGSHGRGRVGRVQHGLY